MAKTSSFVAYIDESGDEGFQFLDAERGSSRWLVVSAVVFRTSKEREAVAVMRDVRERLGKPRDKALHFRELKHEQRVPYIRRVAEAPIRVVSVLIHKPSITEPEKFQNEAHRLYRYASRLLLERVSWLCRNARKPSEGDGTVDLIFSNRSAMSYEDLRSYLQRLEANSIARDVRVDWSVVRPEAVRAVNHDQLAGLQIADAVASGVFFALNLNQYGESEPRYFTLLRPTFYRHKQLVAGYGLKFWPADLMALQKTLPHLGVLAEGGGSV